MKFTFVDRFVLQVLNTLF